MLIDRIMKKQLLLLVATIAGMAAQAQQLQSGTASALLETDNIRTSVLNAGDMFWTGNDGYFEVPKGSGKHTIFVGALWMGGLDQNNQIRLSAQTYRQSDRGYFPGPVASAYGTVFGGKYDRIWSLTRAEINAHRTLFNAPGYTAPPSIATWPAYGNTANGEAQHLAPFVDVDADGIYSPHQGDYPDVMGDVAAFFILNDDGGLKDPYTPSMKAEVHVLVYGFNGAANPCLGNTLFVRYKLINRSTETYHDMHVGQWIDFDLGDWQDDFLGSLPTQDAFYAYNGAASDAVYGTTPPAQAFVMLNQNMSSFVAYNADGTVRGNPDTEVHYYNYLKATWKNGNHVTDGGNGYGGQTNADFMYSGDPVQNSGWTEGTAGHTPGDRRGVGAFGPFIWAPGQEIIFDAALVFARGTDNINSVAELQQCLPLVHNYYNNVLVSAPDQQTAGTRPLWLYPNPTTGLVSVQLEQTGSPLAKIEIYDMAGRLQHQEQVTATAGSIRYQLYTEGLAKGVYSVKVTGGAQVQTARLVKM